MPSDARCPACGTPLHNLGWTAPAMPGSDPLVCIARECPRPTAAREILADPERKHILVLYRGSYSLRHPLRERLPRPDETEAELLTCDVGEWVDEFGPTMTSGSEGFWKIGVRYRVWMDYDDSPAGQTGENGTHLQGELLDG